MGHQVSETSIPDRNPRRQGEAPPSSKGRFEIEILSVYYYPERRNVRAAVVLKTSFILHGDRKLKYAECPIAVYPEDRNSEPLAIGDYHPIIDEHVQVDYRTGQKYWHLNPAVNVMEAGAQIGSVGATRSDNKASTISLRAINRQETIPRISWYYQAGKNTIYPGVVTVLLIIENENPKGAPWFEFDLKLTRDLKVDVHGKKLFTDFRDRWVGVPEDGDGWTFKIRGQFNPDYAMTSLSRPHTSDSNVGLKAAARSMLDALSPP